MDLMTQATREYDGGKGGVHTYWEILLKWGDVIKIKNANAHAQRKKEARLEIACSRLGVASTAHPPFPG